MSKETKEVKVETIEINEAVKRMMELLNAFMQQEMGNKITQFNMQGLAQMVELTLTKKE